MFKDEIPFGFHWRVLQINTANLPLPVNLYRLCSSAFSERRLWAIVRNDPYSPVVKIRIVSLKRALNSSVMQAFVDEMQ